MSLLTAETVLTNQTLRWSSLLVKCKNMNLNILANLVEQLRINIIGDPEWNELKNVFEYQN